MFLGTKLCVVICNAESDGGKKECICKTFLRVYRMNNANSQLKETKQQIANETFLSKIINGDGAIEFLLSSTLLKIQCSAVR